MSNLTAPEAHMKAEDVIDVESIARDAARDEDSYKEAVKQAKTEVQMAVYEILESLTWDHIVTDVEQDLGHAAKQKVASVWADHNEVPESN